MNKKENKFQFNVVAYPKPSYMNNEPLLFSAMMGDYNNHRDDKKVYIKDNVKTIAKSLSEKLELNDDLFGKISINASTSEMIRKHLKFPKLQNGADVIAFDEDSNTVLAKFKNEFVTWFKDQENSCSWGHYFSKDDLDEALNDFSERSGLSLDYRYPQNQSSELTKDKEPSSVIIELTDDNICRWTSKNTLQADASFVEIVAPDSDKIIGIEEKLEGFKKETGCDPITAGIEPLVELNFLDYNLEKVLPKSTELSKISLSTDGYTTFDFFDSMNFGETFKVRLDTEYLKSKESLFIDKDDGDGLKYKLEMLSDSEAYRQLPESETYKQLKEYIEEKKDRSKEHSHSSSMGMGM